MKEMTFIVKGWASSDQVIQTYRDDSQIVITGGVWPATAVERVALVAKARRRAEDILTHVWQLCELDAHEFRTRAYAVWSKTAADHIWSWTFGEMFDHIDANPTWVPQPADPKKWAAVQSWRPRMKANPPARLGPLISFQNAAGHIVLDDGHTRLMAAHLEKVFPKTMLLYLGVPGVVV
jgi:hypothetical protein